MFAMPRHSSREGGVALIEALVAMAIMAFGLLSVVGLQATLRQNADVAKQRAEAIRIAQAEVETWRAFAVLQGPAGTIAYANLVNGANGAVNGSNAQYLLTRTVVDAPGASYKILRVDVGWVDRSNQNQNVRLSTALHGVAPELAGTVSVLPNGLPTAQAGGRAAGIPLAAVPLSGSTSGFIPPNRAPGDQTAWLFNNLTGLIQVCTSVVASNAALAAAAAAAVAAGQDPSNLIGNCAATRAELLSGYVNFADPAALATAQQAVNPTGAAQAVQVQVHRTAPADLLVGPGTGCFTDVPSGVLPYVAYYCAVPIDATLPVPQQVWSGYSYVLGQAAGQSVCRYTRYRDNRLVPAIQNIEHPNAYLDVGGPLANQNFLVVLTVDAVTAANNCPDGAPLPANFTTYPQPTPP